MLGADCGTRGSAILAEQRPSWFPVIITPLGCFHSSFVNLQTIHRSDNWRISRSFGWNAGCVGVMDPWNIWYAYLTKGAALGCHRTCHFDLLFKLGVNRNGKWAFVLKALLSSLRSLDVYSSSLWISSWKFASRIDNLLRFLIFRWISLSSWKGLMGSFEVLLVFVIDNLLTYLSSPNPKFLRMKLFRGRLSRVFFFVRPK